MSTKSYRSMPDMAMKCELVTGTHAMRLLLHPVGAEILELVFHRVFLGVELKPERCPDSRTLVAIPVDEDLDTAQAAANRAAFEHLDRSELPRDEMMDQFNLARELIAEFVKAIDSTGWNLYSSPVPG